MNTAVAAAVVALSFGVNQHPESRGPFTHDNVKAIYGKALFNKINVPLEVIGYKKHFACMLNHARCQSSAVNKNNHLTQHEVDELLHSSAVALSDGLTVKLQGLIEQAHTQVQRRIKNEKRRDEVTHIKQAYLYNYDFTQWHQSAIIPLTILNKIPAYVENFNLE
jgi:hypothetical protein